MKQKEFLSGKNPLLSELREMPDVRISNRIVAYFCVVLLFGALFSALVNRIAEAMFPALQTDSAASMMLMLYLTGFTILLVLLACRFGENRPLRTTGIRLKGLLPQYLTGAAAGFAMFGAAVLLAWKCGALTFEGRSEHLSAAALTGLLLSWLVQGFSEEISFRGWLMISSGSKGSVRNAVLQSAALFAVFHLGNHGISIPAVCNLFLFGVFAAFYVLRTGRIWGAAAMHGIWNFAQGNIFGIKVSGIDMPDSVWHFTSSEQLKWLNGGEFGMEGGIAVTAVLLTGIAVLWLLPERRRSAP
ncbi:MAG: CPBP family intramembrane metalloprotease [Oscillospiraceae bacterium]|nr:CPBP family intramembrane metalloprotease [Oscillospiraceae bacterium]